MELTKEQTELCLRLREDLDVTDVDAIAAADLMELLAAHSAGAQEPVAYLHEMHMEGDQMYERLTFDITNAFGEPGRDYSESYEVTCTPLYDHPQPMPQTDAVRDVLTEQRCLTNVELGELRLLIAFCESYLVAPYIDRGSDVDNAMRALRKRIAEIERLDRAKGE